jgi:hypothetical protein
LFGPTRRFPVIRKYLQRLQPLLDDGAVNGDGVHIHNSHSQISAHVPMMTTKAITAAISTE